MLAYLIVQERKDELAKWDADFKNLLLANNVELYQRLFGQETAAPVDDDDVDYLHPQTDGEFQQMMAELKEAGVLDAIKPDP